MPPTPEQVVEGHTVFAVMERNLPPPPPRPAFAAAGDAPAANVTLPTGRYPGVLWFNDQYLVDPRTTANAFTHFGGAIAVLVRDTGRMPCGGAVLAVNAGDQDPRAAYADAAGLADGTLTYVTSYALTDPNDRTWVVDKYEGTTRVELDGSVTTRGGPVWVANLFGHRHFVPDDGLLKCGQDRASGLTRQAACSAGDGGLALVGGSDDAPCAGYREPSDSGGCYAGGWWGPEGCPPAAPRAYDALIYFGTEDLSIFAGARDHTPGANLDATGCQTGTEWACPMDDDNAEGNSHPFNVMWSQGSDSPFDRTNPSTAQPCFAPGSYPANHGGSASLVFTGTDPCDTLHAVFEVDLYYSPDWRPVEPARRTFTELDLEGSAAPFEGLGTGGGSALS